MSVKRRPKNSYFDLLTTADCARVLSAYDLGEVVAIESLIVSSDAIVNLLERSETSRKTVVRTTCGSFFLKQIPWYCAQQELVTFSATLANTCSKNGLPVPAVHRTRNGELYTEYDDCLFTVSDLVVGAQYDGTQKLTRSSASVLAQMHNLGRSCNLKV